VRFQLAEIMPELMTRDLLLVVLGTGEPYYEGLFRSFAEKYPGRIAVKVAYDDTMAHKIRGFIAKAGRAGVTRVFIGLESINPDALKGARKGQNQITEYRAMLQAWHRVGTLTYAGYILGFPGDTPASIERDIRIIQRELPIDLLEFFVLTPLPGSADHKKLHLAGVEMERDLFHRNACRPKRNGTAEESAQTRPHRSKRRPA